MVHFVRDCEAVRELTSTSKVLLTKGSLHNVTLSNTVDPA